MEHITAKVAPENGAFFNHSMYIDGCINKDDEENVDKIYKVDISETFFEMLQIFRLYTCIINCRSNAVLIV